MCLALQEKIIDDSEFVILFDDVYDLKNKLKIKAIQKHGSKYGSINDFKKLYKSL